jgi:hypothetical protein
MRPFFRISKLPSTRKFVYHPRYWDPDKEDLESRLAAHRKVGQDHKIELTKSRIASNFRARKGNQGISFKKSNARLVVILISLIVLTYYFLNTYAVDIVNWIE